MTLSFLMRATATVAITAGLSSAAIAQDFTINVWSGGTGPLDNYRTEAIDIAADLLEREAAIRGEELSITVVPTVYAGWDDFKQALTLSAEAGSVPNIIVSGHEDIAPWSQSGLIVPAEDYLDLEAWPLNDIYPNLIEISSYGDVVWGIPQDAESRPFFFWKPHMLAIGYTEDDLAALPQLVQDGGYTLANALEDAKKMQDAGLVEAGYGFYPRFSNGPDFWQFYTSFGGVMEENGTLVFDRTAMQGMMQFFADAVAAGVTKQNHIGMPGDQWWAEVASGQAGIWHGGTWHYGRLVNQEGLTDFFGNVAFSLIPAGEGGEANTLTHPLVYLLGSGHDEDTTIVAAQLIEIASEPRINTLHAIRSAHLAIAESQSDVELYASDRWASEATVALLPHANAMPNNSNFGAYWTVMWSNLEAVWTGAKTPEAAVADMEAELQATLGDAIIIR